MDQVLPSVALPIVCGSRFNGTTHMCVCIHNIWKHIITMQNLLRAQCMIYDAHWHIVVGTGADTQFSVTFLSWRTHFSKTHHYMAHVCDWHTIVEVYYSVTQYSEAHYAMAQWQPHYCEAHVHTIVRHTSKLSWGTLLCGTIPHHCGAHCNTIVWHTSTLLWGTLLCGTLPNYREAHYCGAHQSWGRPAAIRAGGAPSPVLEIHTVLIISHRLRPLKLTFYPDHNGIGLNGRYVKTVS